MSKHQIEGDRELLKNLASELFENRIYFTSYSRTGIILAEPDSHSKDEFMRVIAKYPTLTNRERK